MTRRRGVLGVVVPALSVICVGSFVTDSQAQGTGAKLNVVQAPYSSPADGPAMYRDYCAACHGSSGKGDGPASVALKAPATDLTRLAANNRGRSQRCVFRTYCSRAR
jgi:hypothetical protein